MIGEMGWFKIDDDIATNTKIQGLSADAFRLWIYGLAHASQHETDGKLDRSAQELGALLARISRPSYKVRELISAGLWDEEGDSVVIHDYLDHQRSRHDIAANRANTAVRQRRFKADKKADTESAGNAVTNALVTHLEKNREEEKRKNLPSVGSSRARGAASDASLLSPQSDGLGQAKRERHSALRAKVVEAAEILSRVKGVAVDPAGIEAAIMQFPTADVSAAAYLAVTWMTGDGEYKSRNAGFTLRACLKKLADEADLQTAKGESQTTESERKAALRAKFANVGSRERDIVTSSDPAEWVTSGG